jgi:geranylgeranyl pyrophosphate synthase
MQKQAGAASEFSDAINKALGRGGKRLRPSILLSVFYCGSQPVNDRVIAVAAALELVHQSSLFHDAVIDSHTGTLNPNDAILIGDYLLAQGLGLSASAGAEYGQMLAAAVAQITVGQAQEFTSSYTGIPSDKFYIETVTNKTAALFSVACRLGAKLGGLSDADTKAFDRYGKFFGISFQIIDDILDGDISAKAIVSAPDEARRYAGKAAASLKHVSQTQLTAGLAKLPDYYLGLALQ